MSVILTPEQQAWLEERVAAGTLPSVEDGVRAAVADLMLEACEDNLAWARSYADAARNSVTAGNVADGEAFFATLSERGQRADER